MIRKVRHPHQVLEATEMVTGQLYAFIHASNMAGDLIDRYIMGGVIDDSHTTARHRGYDLNLEDPQVEWLVNTIKGRPIVTIHMDGWFDRCSGLRVPPTLMYWKGHPGVHGWDLLSAYLGPEGRNGDAWHHSIVVPSQHWNDDPRLHVVDWNNPDCVIERVGVTDAENAASWEQRMRARAHAAMAKANGF